MLLLSFNCFLLDKKEFFIKYQSSNKIIEFDSPESWKITEINECAIISKKNIGKGYLPRFSIIIQLLPDSINENGYLNLSIRQLKNSYDKFTLVNVDSMMFCKRMAVVLEARYAEKGTLLHGLSVFFIQKGRVCSFIGIADDKKWNKALIIFNKVIASVNISLPNVKHPDNLL
jgi:hypothetical protein